MDLQALINSQSPHSTLELPPGEFFGQVIIDRPLTIVGKGQSTWVGSRRGPTIIITCRGVKLQNLTVENTAGPEEIAIEASSGTDPVLESVVVRGLMVGVPLENVKDKAQKNGEPSIQISFLPPPPMSPSDSSDPARSSTAAMPTTGPIQASSAGMPSQSPFAGSGLAHAVAAAPPSVFKSWILAIVRDPMKAFFIGVSVVMGVVIVLQYMDTGKGVTKQIEETKQLSKQLDTEKRQLEQEIDRRKGLVAQKEREIESIKKDKQGLEQQVAKLTATLTQKSRSQAQLAPGWGDQLISAVTKGDANRVKGLLDYGIDCNHKDPLGYSALMRAVISGNTDIISVLLEHGADVNAFDNEGWTPLMFASGRSNEAVVLLLLERGADVNAKSDFGLTALKLASMRKAYDIERLLRSYGAKE